MGAARTVALIAGGVALASAMSACANYGAHLNATPVAPGKRAWHVAADAVLLDRGSGPQVLPNPHLGLRFGLGPNVDLGGRLNAGSLELDSVIRVAQTSALDLAIVPGVFAGFVPATNPDTGVMQAGAAASVLASLRLSSRLELVVGAGGRTAYAFPLTALRGDPEGSKMLYMPVGSSGVRVRLGRKLSLMPAISVSIPYDSQRREWTFPILQGGASLHFE